MGDTQYPYPVALQWNDDPKKLESLKNKLLLYFQKRSESNGGECEIRDTVCSQGYILIYFKEERDRDGVLQKDSHELILSGGKKMNLDVRSVGVDSEWSPPVDSGEDLTPQPPGTEALSNQSQHVTQEPPSSSLILIENLQDSYSLDMLNLLVENISGKRENTDFQVERTPEKQCAVITFTCDIDILRFVEKFSRNSRVQSLKMTAKPLEETRLIRVEGLPPNTSEEYIGLYFENPTHGVPGSMEDTMAIPEEGAALVTFSTVEAEPLVTPPYWDKMDNTPLKVVPLKSSSSDYSEVEGLFTQTCQMRIIKIERIQNTHLYINYQIKKNAINTKNGTRTNEKRLFHGTESATTENINRNGFNRAYAGTNAANLGKGTYFAVEAIYSADDKYSKPDTNGYKYMYLARVLTGVYCVGNKDMVVPPAKNPSNPTDLYDSATDKISRPSVFVTFNDIQAYPEYLITFTK